MEGLSISNLLDNAIEACDKSTERMICLKIVLEKSEMVLSVKNTFDEPVEIESGFIHMTRSL